MMTLVIAQGWFSLRLFGTEAQWRPLGDDRPVVSGRHPLHLYHGYLAARSLLEQGTVCCYDPSFQAGYPQTPVFDGGSRPAALFLLLGGGSYQPAAYKIGLAACCAALPLALALAAWGFGLGRRARCVCAALGIFICWGSPFRSLLEIGDLDLYLAMLAALVQVGLLLRFDRAPGPLSWLGLLVSGCVGWFGQPLLYAGLLIVILAVYYLSVGARHEFHWHLALGSVLLAGLMANAFWLADWVRYSWILAPLPVGDRLLEHRTFHYFWTTSFWGEPADRALALVLFLSAAAGIVLLNRRRGRLAARLLGLGMACLLALAIAGIAWEPAGRVGAAKLLAPALWFAVLPAVYLWKHAVRWLWRVNECPYRTAALFTSLAIAGVWAGWPALAATAEWWRGPEPLDLGLGAEREAIVSTLTAHTTPEARILWEDRPGSDERSRWTALLPLLAERTFIGGLDAQATLEHGFASFIEQQRAGRPLTDWSDADLHDFSRRYNLGWVACWSPAAVARLRAWPLAEAVAPLVEDGQSGWLFALRRPASFVLKGRARWVKADCRYIALGEVEPEDGKVVLSLHYQAGMEVTPSRVLLEKEMDPYDPIPFVRLRVPTPVTRVTIMWRDP